jgi:hypothetical protein
MPIDNLKLLHVKGNPSRILDWGQISEGEFLKVVGGEVVGEASGSGAPGPQGPLGLPGEQGEEGIDGLPGQPGIQGINGKSPIGSSSTSMTIGTGNQTFTIQIGLPFGIGTRVRIAELDGLTWMEGEVFDYTGTSMTVDVDLIGPIGGTFTPWSITIAGVRGAIGANGIPGNDGLDGLEGEQGVPGVIGLQGNAGAAGSQGIPGPQGPVGFPGLDAEEPNEPIMVQGPAGPSGANGSPGAPGANGTSGSIGPPGLDADEPEMPYVIPGERGPQGIQGPAGGGGGSATTIEQNLGSTATWRGKFTITDAAIIATSKILAWQASGPYTGKGTMADEAELQPVSVIAVEPGTGSAVLKWQTPPMLAPKHEPTLGFYIGVPGAPGTNVVTNPRDAQAITKFVLQRRGLVRGNVKFNYLVF